jgi:hypothetical protein
MKTFLLTILLLAGLTAGAQTVSTRIVGNSLATNYVVVTSQATKVFAVTGYTTATQFIQVFQTNALPANGSTPIFSVPVAAGQGYSVDFSFYGADMDKLTVCNSTTANTLTLGAADTTFQAILRR